jgi:hypothetical protein
MIDLLAVEEPKPKPAKIRAVSYEAAIDQLFKRMRSSSSARGQCAQKAGTQRKTSPATATWQVLSKLMFVSSYTWVVTVTVRARAPGRPCP